MLPSCVSFEGISHSKGAYSTRVLSVPVEPLTQNDAMIAPPHTAIDV